MRGDRPVQPVRGRLVAIEHHDVRLVQKDLGRRHRGARRAGDPEHGPGEPVHGKGICRLGSTSRPGDPAQHGRTGQGTGQHIRREAMAQRQVRARLPVPGRRRAGML